MTSCFSATLACGVLQKPVALGNANTHKCGCRCTRLWGFRETLCARSCQIANKFASAATLACGVLGAFAPRGEGGEQRSANQGETSPFLIFLYFSGSSGELWNFL